MYVYVLWLIVYVHAVWIIKLQVCSTLMSAHNLFY